MPFEKTIDFDISPMIESIKNAIRSAIPQIQKIIQDTRREMK